MKIKPLQDNILILLEKAEENKSGIIIPNQEKHKTDRGLVVRIGSEAQEVKVNDKVIFRKWEGEEIEYRECKYILISQDNIIATLI